MYYLMETCVDCGKKSAIMFYRKKDNAKKEKSKNGIDGIALDPMVWEPVCKKCHFNSTGAIHD